ncbi:hypothetical protein BDV41DRAFT_534398 [Aspergillus transmontanensis]|uniref:Uncharacterized protein n=1 Tax=Aspergillus transmontanensis TaxID=1034304 RepID=A0A5N6W089_9EURO|nr:hypothetical protein BDV41DRAFT_534398 [Aspergillus transmontanensis]
MPGCISWGDKRSFTSILHPRAAAKDICAAAAPLVGYNCSLYINGGLMFATHLAKKKKCTLLIRKFS